MSVPLTTRHESDRKNGDKDYYSNHYCALVVVFVVIGVLLTLLLSIVLIISQAFTIQQPLDAPQNKTVLYSRSVQALQDLTYMDLLIAQILAMTVNKLPQNSSFRRASEIYLEDLRNGIGIQSLDDFTKAQALSISKNPIGSYRTIRRMVTLLPDLSSHAKANDIFGEEALNYLNQAMPDQDDLNKAMDGILRIHHIYDLNITMFANGNVSGILTGAKLDAVHCYEIGVYGSDHVGYYAHAVDWLELALNKITINGDQSIDTATVSTAFMKAIKKHDKMFKKSEDSGTEQYLFESLILPMVEDEPSNFSKRRTRRSVDVDKYKGSTEPNIEKYNYLALCVGETFQSEAEKSELFCWLEFKVHPQFFIGPMKMEFLTRSPDLVRVYEVVGETMMEAVKRETSEHMQPAQVIAAKVARGTVMNTRTAESSLLNDGLEEFLPLSSTISHLTGLDAVFGEGSEPFQVAAYTSSGHYDPHIDSGVLPEYRISPYGNQWGDRIATFMIYLSDVEAGGYTVFANLGVAVKPVKGSAIFWYNVFRNEQVDYLLMHGACPVLIGRKYVGNKWIHYLNQVSTHKCSTEPKDQFHVAVNQKHIPASRVVRNQKINRHMTYIGRPGFNSTKYSYRSIQGLKALAEVEQKIYKIVKLAYLQFNENNTIPVAMECDEAFEKNHLCVQNYLNDFEDSTGMLGGGKNASSANNGGFMEFETLPPEKIYWNPIAVYRMVWRAHAYLKKWSNAASKNNISRSYEKTFTTVKGIYRHLDSPIDMDLKDAKVALLSIQEAYDLHAKDMASGRLAGRSTGVTLNAQHCYEIGIEAISVDKFALGIDWLEVALFKATFNTDSSIGQKKLKKALRSARKTYNKQRVAINETEHNHSEGKMFENKGQHKASGLIEERKFAEVNFNGVCSGKLHLSPVEKSKLFCWYETEIDPYWKINPLKAEFHSLRPKLEVVQYYDILSDKIMDSLKQNVMNTKVRDPLMAQNSKVVGALSSWVMEHENEDAFKISKLVDRVTGLTTQNPKKYRTRDFQVTAFVPGGGTHSAHMDVPTFVYPGHSAFTIATFMFYMSDVELGGYTAFAEPGAKIMPRKGSAVFWYYLLRSGQPNQRTYHGECPVVLGEKWVATKWISYEHQSRHMCHLTEAGTAEVLVNGASKYV